MGHHLTGGPDVAIGVYLFKTRPCACVEGIWSRTATGAFPWMYMLFLKQLSSRVGSQPRRLDITRSSCSAARLGS